MVKRFEYEIFADYFQFYLQDETAAGDLSDSWTPEAVDRLLAIAAGVVGVGTARNMPVPVVVEVNKSTPDDSDLSEWDQVNECSLEVSSGKLVIAGCTDYLPDATRIDLNPCSYRIRIHYGKVNSVTDPNAPEGDDNYKIVMWPAPLGPVTIIKQRERPASAQY
jgi:hypothetical protein